MQISKLGHQRRSDIHCRVTEQIHRVHALQDTNERDDPADHEGGRPIDPAKAFNPGFRVQQVRVRHQPEGDYGEIRLVFPARNR